VSISSCFSTTAPLSIYFSYISFIPFFYVDDSNDENTTPVSTPNMVATSSTKNAAPLVSTTLNSSTEQSSSKDRLTMIADATAQRNLLHSSDDADFGFSMMAETLPDLENAPDSMEEWNRYVRFTPVTYAQKDKAESYLISHENKADSYNIETLHSKGKRTTFLRFLVILCSHQTLSKLVEMVDDDQMPGTKVLRLIKLLRGEKTQAKKDLLNTVMGVWLVQMLPIDSGKLQYQPNTMTLYIRMVFKVLWDCCVEIQNQDLKSCRNSYHIYLTNVWARAAEIDADFGRRPNRATVEHDDQYKMRNCASPPLDPINSYDDLLMMTMYAVGNDLKLRIGEVRFFLSFFFHSPLTIDLSFSIYRKLMYELQISIT